MTTSHRALARAVFPFRRHSPAGFGRLSGLVGLTLGALLSLAPPLVAEQFKLGVLEIDHPYARAASPGAKVAGGYLIVKNTGAESDRLVAVTAEIAGRTEIHEMSMNDGIMRMRPVTGGLEIPAAGELVLAPGKLHLMFLDLERLPAAGETFRATLTFEKAGTVEVEFSVEAPGLRGDGNSG